MKNISLFKTLYCIILLVLFTQCTDAQKTSTPEETKEEPLYIYPTVMDTIALKKFIGVMSRDTFDAARLPEYRKFLEPYLAKKDGFAEYLYASTFDLYQYGKGKESDAKIALEHYIKASELHYAPAHLFLYHLYRYSFMQVPADMNKAMFYLDLATKEGGSESKAKAHGELAGLYYKPEEGTGLKPDTLKAIENLEKAVSYNPKDTWAMDFLSSIYEDKGRFQDAMKFRLKSDNSQSKIKAALWMIEGKKVTKDVAAGVKILQGESEKIWPDYEDYMGVENPVYLLNKLYLCDKLIGETEVGKYRIDYYRCGGG